MNKKEEESKKMHVATVSSPFLKQSKNKKRRLLSDTKNCLLDSNESENDNEIENESTRARTTRSKAKTTPNEPKNTSKPLKNVTINESEDVIMISPSTKLANTNKSKTKPPISPLSSVITQNTCDKKSPSTHKSSSPRRLNIQTNEGKNSIKMTRSVSKLNFDLASSSSSKHLNENVKENKQKINSTSNTKQTVKKNSNEKKSPYIEIDIDGHGVTKVPSKKSGKENEIDSDSDCVMVSNHADPGI